MVARETSPSPSAELGPAIASVLGELGLGNDRAVVERLTRFSVLLLMEAIPRGFLGPEEGVRLIGRHVAESAALATLLTPRDDLVIDVGSGAGLPGLVIACLGRRVELIESQERRAAFLAGSVGALGLDVVVHRMRAEDAGRSALRASADVAVSRALAEPAVALELCLPLVRVGGRCLCLVTRSREAEAQIASAALSLGGAPPRWEVVSVPGAEGPRYVMIVDKVDPTPERFPRRPGVPKRRPLGR